MHIIFCSTISKIQILQLNNRKHSKPHAYTHGCKKHTGAIKSLAISISYVLKCFNYSKVTYHNDTRQTFSERSHAL